MHIQKDGFLTTRLISYLSSVEDLLGPVDSVSSTIVCESSITEPSMATALAHRTDGIPFRVLVRTFVNFSFDGEIPSTSVRSHVILCTYEQNYV